MSQSRQMKAYVPLHILAVPQTDVGRTRDHNEDVVGIAIPGGPVCMYTNEGVIGLPAVGDAAILRAKGALFLVADGMGGYQAGEVASDLAARTIIHEYYADPNDNVAESLRRAISKANAAVYAWGQASAQRKGMGTTVAAAVVRGAETHIAWVGDSRIYLLRNGVLQQSTEDHSFVNDLVRTGVLSPEEARNHPQKNVVTRALGHRPDVEIDSRTTQLQPDDRLLICSDGLSGPVADPQLEAILKQHAPEDAVPRLVQAANVGGGPDNISVIVLAAQAHSGAGLMVEERRPAALPAAPTTPPPPTISPPSSGSSPLLKWGIAAFILLVIAGLLFGVWRLLSMPRNGAGNTPTPTIAQPTSGVTPSMAVIEASSTLEASPSPGPTSTATTLKPTSTVQPPTPTPEATPTPAPTPTPRCERRAPELVSPAPDATHYSGVMVHYEWQGGQLCAGDQWRVSFFGNGRQDYKPAGGGVSVEWALDLNPGDYSWMVDMLDVTGAVVPGMSSGARTIHFQTASGGEPTCDATKDSDGDGVNDCNDKCPNEAAVGSPNGCR